MDRITQTQDGIDQLVDLMHNSLLYLEQKAGFKQVNPDVPITELAHDAQSEEKLAEVRKELISDLVKKTKQVELLISSLPDPPDPAKFDAEYEALEAEEQQVDDAYVQAVEEAETLNQELERTLDDMIAQKAARDIP